MYLFDENFAPIDVEALKDELKEDQLKDTWTDEIDEGELEYELAEMYLTAADATAHSYYSSEKLARLASERALAFSPALAGKNIFRRVRTFVCKFLKEGSTLGEIVDAVLEALSSILPGGIIIEKVVKKLVRFIINRGLTRFCGWE